MDINLTDKNTSIEFYEHRYSDGYMEEWPAKKKQRVLEILKNLPLPETGDALDFGCGNGIFTDVIKQALPQWNVYGTDISQVAIDNAREKFSRCIFFVSSDEKFASKKFDFLFTHHVLEHVYNLFEVWEQMQGFSQEKSWMLHILPCGNEGSFEHQLASLVKNDANSEKENCYFFEEPGHLRRLNTEKFTSIAAKYNFKLVIDYYANQYYGALDWIMDEAVKYIIELGNPPLQAKDNLSKIKLLFIIAKLLVLYIIRYPALILETAREDRRKSLKHFCWFILLMILYPFSWVVNSNFEKKVAEEWKNRKRDKNGSEMYLFFEKT